MTLSPLTSEHAACNMLQAGVCNAAAYTLTSTTCISFRDQWSFEKKIKKARAKKNKSLADSLAQRRPSYRIDHLVKERYDLRDF